MTIIMARVASGRQWLYLLVAIFSSLWTASVQAELLYNTTVNTSQIANTLDGPGLGVTNLVITRGLTGQYGIFNQGISILSVDTGVFMTTGNLGSLQGPNTQAAYSANNKVNYLDANLATISNNAKYDPAIIEFDIVPQGDKANFVFVFGSEEYPEYVCSRFNDAFGLFISGPGLSGVQNAAFMPNSHDAIAVNNVNSGQKGSSADGAPCNLTNTAYFTDNGNGGGSPILQLDGYTKPITTSIGGLIAGQTYHVKLAIADAGDPGYDSSVLFKWLTSTKSELVDLSLQGNSSNLTPAFNAEVELTYTLTNNSVINTRLVQVDIPLPSGMTWLGDDSQGTYEVAKGIWNADSISANQSKTLKIRAKVGTDNLYTINGEISYAFNEDSDSKPFNRTVSPDEDDTALITLKPLAQTANQSPVITSNGGKATATITINENQTAVTTVTATDADKNRLSYGISGGKDATLFTINSNSGELVFITAPDYENPVDADKNNNYELQVGVSDGLISTTQAITVKVLDVKEIKENVAPIITSNGGGDTATINLDENITAVTRVIATDADKDTLTYSISGGVDAALFKIAANTGRLSFIIAPDFEKPASKNNLYEVQVTVSDGSLKDNQLLIIQILDVQEGHAPVIYSNNGGDTVYLTIPENQTVVTTVQATDVDNDSITYKLSSNNDEALFQINTNSGKLAFIKPPDFENPLSINSNNIYKVTVIATDGVFETKQLLVISITNVAENVAPVIINNGGDASATVSVAENKLTVLQVNTADANQDTLTYSIIGGEDASFFQIGADGLLSFRQAPDFENPLDSNKDNVYIVKVMVSDSKLTASQLINIVVTDVFENIAPIITSHAGKPDINLALNENTTYVTVVSATDANSTDTISYSISAGVDANKFTINKQNGTLQFINPPDYENPLDANKDNVYEVTVTATDGTANAEQVFHITVQDVADVPYINLSMKTILQGAYRYSMKMMANELTRLKIVPTLQPYGELKTAFGYTDSGGFLSPFDYHGTETAADTVLNASGNDAIVDWVLVELRDVVNPSKRQAAIAALLQRDGDVVDAATGSTTLKLMNVIPGSYYVMVRHRNHLALMTAKPIALSLEPVLIDFTNLNTPVYGENLARLTENGIGMMWAGDTNNSNSIIANGPGSDSSVILGAILVHPENTLVNTAYRLPGYYASDLNMDGLTIFSGPSNDINLLLANILMFPANTNIAANYILLGQAPR